MPGIGSGQLHHRKKSCSRTQPHCIVSRPSQTAITDEKKLYDRLLSFSGREWHNEKNAQEKALRDATNRISFIEDASKRLFEEKITGNVPESLFRKMFADYERELSEYSGFREQPVRRLRATVPAVRSQRSGDESQSYLAI